MLLQYFPIATKLFSRVEHLITLDFLEQYPTPEVARTLSPTTLQAFFKQHHYTRSDRADAFLAMLQKPMPAATVVEGYLAQSKLLIPLLRELYHQIARLEKEIAAVFKTHPEAEWWRSFPGAKGPLTPARLLAWIGDDRSRFPTAQTLQAIAGTAPVTRRSGKSLSVEFRRACSHPLAKGCRWSGASERQILRLGTRLSESAISAGHSKTRAYRALANRWMKIIWTLWQRREIYREATHVANRLHRLPQAA